MGYGITGWRRIVFAGSGSMAAPVDVTGRFTDVIDVDWLRGLVASGIVRAHSHPTLPLTIYNYTEKCQHERLWDAVSLQCRGLVMHGDKVIARPFPKFFNDTEHNPEDIPWNSPCTITEKLDGSLLIAFWFGGWHVATRGSFDSQQAKWGESILKSKYAHCLPAMVPDETYLFELLHPDNKIVVDYGNETDVVLLARIVTATGYEPSLDTAPSGLRTVRRVSPQDVDLRQLRTIIRDDEEGYVVRFDCGFRVKVKGERYIERHRIVSGLSSRRIWEMLATGQSLDIVRSSAPEECLGWIEETANDLCRKHQDIYERAIRAAAEVADLPTRKAQAEVLLSRHADIASWAFAVLDGKSPSERIWRTLSPPLEYPPRTAQLRGVA